MENRISRDELYTEVAKLIAKRGTCQRAQVGAVITIDNRIVATGYNGQLGFGDLNTCLKECDTSLPCTKGVHAEANAIAFSAKLGIAIGGGVLYCTHSPCLKCSELIIQAGIVRVVYSNPYRDPTGVNNLITHGIGVEHCPQKSPVMPSYKDFMIDPKKEN